MTVGEKLKICATEVFDNCIKTFQSRGVDPQTGLFILDNVYKQVQELALTETNKHLSQTTAQYEMLKASLNTEDNEDTEVNDGDTTQTGSVQ